MAWYYALCSLVLLGAIMACHPSVELFQQYIQINTTTGADLSPAVEFWRDLAEEQGLPFSVYTYEEGYPVVVIKWPGTDPSLSSIMLSSHMDVVPAGEDPWTYPPFSGYLSDDGVIWGRGTQDMKSVSIQHFEALRRLKDAGFENLRDTYMALMPDEEISGHYGMIPFLDSPEFEEMNVGFAMDEGASYDAPFIPLFYQDKVPWKIQIDCYGGGSHGSLLGRTNSTATGKCLNVMNTLLEFREEQYIKSLEYDITDASGYTSVNLNIMKAGTAVNITPNHVMLVFDIRLATNLNEASFEAQLNQWITEAGDNITLKYISKSSQSPGTRVDSNNPYWTNFQTAANQLGITVVPIIPPGSTSARYIRAAGIPAFGFSPMPNTETLMHRTDERLSVDIFLDGIDIFEKILGFIVNISGDQTSLKPSDYNVQRTTTD